MSLKRRAWSALRFVLGTHLLERSFAALPDDRMLVSYPRSGSTWLRFLVSNLAFFDGGPTTFENLNDRIPYALRPAERTLRRLPRPRLLKSHSAYDRRFRHVLLLVRDPRDVAISYYHYHQRRGRVAPDCTLGDYVPRFVTGRMDRYGTWGENVGSWLGAREATAGFGVVRYEDLIADTEGELRRIARLLDIPAPADRVRMAVANSGPEVMRPRSATPGEWRETLDASSVAAIERPWRRTMERLGYRCSEPGAGASPGTRS